MVTTDHERHVIKGKQEELECRIELLENKLGIIYQPEETGEEGEPS